MSLLFFEQFLSFVVQPGAPGSDTLLAQPQLQSLGRGREGRGRADEVVRLSRQLISILLTSLSNVWDLKGDKCNCFPFINMSGSMREFKILLHIYYQGDLCSQLSEILSVPW